MKSHILFNLCENYKVGGARTSSVVGETGGGGGCSLLNVMLSGVKSASANDWSGTWNDARVLYSGGEGTNSTTTSAFFFPPFYNTMADFTY